MNRQATDVLAASRIATVSFTATAVSYFINPTYDFNATDNSSIVNKVDMKIFKTR